MRNRSSRNTWMVLLLVLSLCAGCASQQASQADVSPSEPLESLSAPTDEPSIEPPSPEPSGTESGMPAEATGQLANYNRAEGYGQYGTLALVPEEGEMASTLDAPSCYGNEGDNAFSGVYHVIYRNKEGDSAQDLGVIGDEIRSPAQSSEILAIPHLLVDGVDIYYFHLLTNTCYGSDYFFYGVNSDGKAFPVSFAMDKKDELYEHFTLYLDRKPLLNENGTVTIESYGDEGSMPPEHLRYVFRLKDDKFILISRLPAAAKD
ncbi:hypothetical protein D7Z26_20225 [Cohnella endophytica]|uniref:Uncharacterized protein n=1 Tax=Cohnella endophytica TaxID=2419778 RepID=A0A494XPX9_9BACL|nr:hypothetical protein [Cohnella endophytica]RKP50134.1 hypothetical protein D7Z26_20225 [Cohnella endophytica]